MGVNQNTDIHTTVQKPSPQCQLFFDKVFRPMSDNLLKLSISLKTLVEKVEQLAKTVHGEDYDGGLVRAVKDHDAVIEELKALPDALRAQVLRWGFYLLGAQTVLTGVFIAVLTQILRMYLMSTTVGK